MHTVKAISEISVSPETVRKMFLDFPQIPVYHPDGWIKSITPANPNKPLEVGDTLNNVLAPFKDSPKIVENTPSTFSWQSALPPLFTGVHSFYFEPSVKTLGGTTFIQQEVFTGLLSFIMGHGWIARWIGLRAKTDAGFESFNEDLKAWCEGSNSNRGVSTGVSLT